MRWLASICLIPLVVSPGRLEDAGSACATPAVTIIVSEEWQPSCLLAVPELAGIMDPSAFENAAFAWLAANEESVARKIAERQGMRLIRWWHDDSTNDTPYGCTVVELSFP